MASSLLELRARPRSWGQRLLPPIARGRLTIVGGMITLLVIVVAVFAPIIAPYDPLAQNPRQLFADPSAQHLMGTDDLGRDILSRVIYGARASLYVGIVSVSIAVICGSFLGLVAGFYGGWLDSVITRFLDIIFAFPTILLALGIVGMLGPSLTNAMIAIGIINIPVYARLVRATTLATKRREFVEAAVVIGCTYPRVLRLHIFPNITAPLIVQTSLSFSIAVLTEASLSFLGLGTQPPDPSWGTMVSIGQRLIELSPWQAVFPGIAIAVTVLGINLVGDGLRDTLDPRLRN